MHIRRIVQKQKHGRAKKQKGARRRADRKKRQSRKRGIKNPVSRRCRYLKKLLQNIDILCPLILKKEIIYNTSGGFCEKKNSLMIVRGTTGGPIFVSLNKLMGDVIDVTALC